MKEDLDRVLHNYISASGWSREELVKRYSNAMIERDLAMEKNVMLDEKLNLIMPELQELRREKEIIDFREKNQISTLVHEVSCLIMEVQKLKGGFSQLVKNQPENIMQKYKDKDVIMFLKDISIDVLVLIIVFGVMLVTIIYGVNEFSFSFLLIALAVKLVEDIVNEVK